MNTTLSALSIFLAVLTSFIAMGTSAFILLRPRMAKGRKVLPLWIRIASAIVEEVKKEEGNGRKSLKDKDKHPALKDKSDLP